MLSREDGPALVRIVIYVALPPLIFLIIVRADLHGSLLLIPIAAFAVHVVLLGIGWALTRVWGMEPTRAGALILAVAVGNTGFFGLPLIAASGAGFSLPAAVLYDVGTGLITWTLTVAVASSYGRAPGAAAPLGAPARPIAAAAAQLGPRGRGGGEPRRGGRPAPAASSAPWNCWRRRSCRSPCSTPA